MRSARPNRVTKFDATRELFGLAVPRVIIPILLFCSAIGALTSPLCTPSAAELSLPATLMAMLIIFSMILVSGAIAVALLLAVTVPLVLSIYTENSERWNIRITSATTNASAALVARIITDRIRRSGPGFHGRWLKLPGAKYVFVPCERKRMWLFRPYFVIEKNPMQELRITYVIVQRWRLKLPYPRRFREPRRAGWPIPYWGGVLRAIRKSELGNRRGKAHRSTTFYVVTLLDLGIVLLIWLGFYGIDLAEYVISEPLFLFQHGMRAALCWLYSVWFLSAMPRCLFALAYARKAGRIPYSPSFALAALLLDAGFILMPTLAQGVY